MKKRHFLMWLAMLLPVWPAFATVYEGACGPQTRYSLDTETGVLSITGTGSISHPSGTTYTYAPWYEHWSSVKKVVIADGVGLPDYEMFAGCDTTLHGMVYNSTTLYYVPQNYYEDYQIAHGYEDNYDEDGYLPFLPEGCKIIAPHACRDVIGFERIRIPEGYEEIGDYAFTGNCSFAEVRLPESMKRIGKAFTYCDGMGGINIPEGLEEIAIGCFERTSIWQPLYNSKTFFYMPQDQTGEYAIPGNPERIADGAFYYSNLSAVHIPQSVKRIGDSAFTLCKNLKELTLPDGLESIGIGAFSSSGLETISIPDGAAIEGGSTFLDCNSLASVSLPSGMTVMPEQFFSGCMNLREVELPVGIDSIKRSAFNNSGIMRLKLPDGVKYIGDYAFYGCRSLQETNLPESVEHVGVYAYSDCQKSLKEPLYNSKIFACMASRSGEYTVPDGIQYIAAAAFYSCDTLTAIHLPASVTGIGVNVFGNCTRLQSMELPAGVKEVPSNAFQGCSSLASVTLPASVTVIGYYAFNGCESLSSVTLPDGLEAIGDGAFRTTYLKILAIPAQVDSIGSYAFADNIALTTVDIRPDIQHVGNGIFQNCPNLLTEVALGGTYHNCPKNATECVIPEGIEYIAPYAFSNCQLLQRVTLPESVKTIGEGAFQNCSMLQSIEIPGQVRRIEDRTFEGCYRLASVQLPDSLELIGSYAFQYCAFANISLPEALTYIGSYAFQGCTNLEEADLPDGIKSLSGYTFYECVFLRSVNLPDKLIRISNSDFCGCKALASISLPEGVTYIGENAFLNCSALKTIHIPAATTTVGYEAFKGCTELASITVDEANDDYRSYSGVLYEWDDYNGKYYVDIIPEGITEIAAPPFLDYYPSSLEIDDYFCQQYPKVRSVVIPASWEGGYSSGQERVFLGEIFESLVGDTTYTETVDRVEWTYKITKYSLPAQIKKLTLYCDTLYQSNMNRVSSSSVNGYTGKWNGYGVFMNDLDTLVIYAATDIDPSVLNSRCRNLKSLTLNRVETLPAQCFKDMDHLQSLTIDSAGVMEQGSMQHLVSLEELTLPFAGAGSAYTASSFGELFGSVANDKKQRVVQFKEDGSSQTYYVPAGLEKLTLKEGFESLPYGALYNCSMLKEIVFPSSLYMVGERALYGCAGLTDIYCKGAEPSSAYSNTFEGVRVNSCKLHVPYNSSDMYRRSTGWKDFYYIEEEAPITISVVKNIENAGVIYGLQEYQAGDEAELRAVANSGYVFSGWTENGVMVSEEGTYVFTVEGDRSLIAVFAPVSGSNDITAVPETDRVSFTWTAEEGAESYRLDVFTDEEMTELAGTLYFDAAGQVIKRSVQLTATIDGLAASTDYYYRMTAYDADETVISQYTGTFATTAGVGIGSVWGTDGCLVRSVEGGIVVNGADGQFIRVFTASGAVAAARTAAGGRERIALDKGFYVVEVAGKAYKVIVR